MKRRQVIVLCGGTALAGCTGQTDAGTEDDGPTPTTTEQPTSTPDTKTETATATASESPTDTSEPAEFELLKYEFPEQVEIGEQFTPAITLRNTGGNLAIMRRRCG